MSRPFQPDPDDVPVPPACGPTVARVQAVLDGDVPFDALAADPHPAACATCRERIRAARVLLAALAEPTEPVAVPVGLTAAILAGVRADRRARGRRRVFAAAGGLAAAAAVVVAVWVMARNPDVAKPSGPPAPDMTEHTPAPGPARHPIRINDELAKAGDALVDSSRTLTEPAAAGPKVFAALTDSLLRPTTGPVTADLEPARKSLADIPEAARTGLEPVTDSAQKAFTRLLRDVGAVPPGKPKS